MLKYAKTTQNAIAALSYLARRYDGGTTLISSAQIAQDRRMPQTLVAKLLSNLSQAGLVIGSPGPRGGYALAKPPGEITFQQVAEIFGRPNDWSECPLAPDGCTPEHPCSLHRKLKSLNADMTQFMKSTTLEIFRDHPETSRH